MKSYFIKCREMSYVEGKIILENEDSTWNVVKDQYYLRLMSLWDVSSAAESTSIMPFPFQISILR
jgi:hypothetical protein